MKLPNAIDYDGWLKGEPRDYQIKSLAFGCAMRDAGIILDMGLGKTKVAIDIARYRIQEDTVSDVLVICPSSIMEKWKEEIERFSEYNALVIGQGSRSYRISRIQNLAYRFYIINYEALQPYIRHLLDRQFEMVIFDESAKYIKYNYISKKTGGGKAQSGSNRFNASLRLADEARFRLILTGTLISKRPLNVWPQFRIMDKGETFGTNFHAFRNSYFIRSGFTWNMRRSKISTFQNAIFRKCIRFTKEECLNLPDKVYDVLYINMDNQLKSIYNNMKEKVKREIIKTIPTDSGITKFTIKNLLVKLQKLQQITSGFIYDDEKVAKELKSQPKLEAVLEQIETVAEEEQSVVVWCIFRHSIIMLERELKNRGIKCITMKGGDKKKNDRWRIFQKDRSITAFIGQIQSGGVGLELFKEGVKDGNQYCFFYENPYSFDERQQNEDRMHRSGQKQVCVYKDFIIKKSRDERILRIIKEDKDETDLIMKDFKKWLEEI